MRLSMFFWLVMTMLAFVMMQNYFKAHPTYDVVILGQIAE